MIELVLETIDKESHDKKSILLDSNIVQYISHNKLSDQILSFLDTLINKGYKLAISDISVCEIFSGCTPTQEEECNKNIREFGKVGIDNRVVLVAARLQNIYKFLNINNDQINLGDRIIASTSIVMGFDLLTADINDFPRPIFREKHEELFFYKHHNKTNLQIVQILTPNWDLVRSYFTREV
ncbi:MAG: PIN domain-containing protein [Patescibacteria group bacterium]